MSAHSLLERPRCAAQLLLRQAHLDNQARKLGECVCGASKVLHFTVSGGRRRFAGCDVARRRAAGAEQLVAVVALHAVQSATSALPGKGHSR
jgi:hypothetical protein